MLFKSNHSNSLYILILFSLYLFQPAGLIGQTSNSQTLNRIDPEKVGYKKVQLENIGKNAAKGIPSLACILVWSKGGLIYEGYFHGADEKTSLDVKSVTKSIISAIVGIANDNGLLPNLETPVLDILPEYRSTVSNRNSIWYKEFIKKNDSIREQLTLDDLLSMKSGILWDDNNPLIHRAFQSSSDPVRFVLELPFENNPGTTFRYCTGACQVVSAILEKSIGQNIQNYADSLLFKPLGMNISSWPVDPQGRAAAGAAICTDAVSLLKFGLLYLNKGSVNGKQIISAKWIEESTSEKTELGEWDVMPSANGYGYYWWRRKINGHQAFVASGYGGQLICIVPDKELVVVTTCFVNEVNRGRSEIQRLHGFIDQIVRSGNK